MEAGNLRGVTIQKMPAAYSGMWFHILTSQFQGTQPFDGNLNIETVRSVRSSFFLCLEMQVAGISL